MKEDFIKYIVRYAESRGKTVPEAAQDLIVKSVG